MFDLLPTIQPNKIAIKVTARVEKIIRQRHPWIFENGIVKQNIEGKAGDLAIIFDNKKNKLIAIGLFDPFSPIRIKVIQHLQPAKINEDWFRNKITTAFEKRADLLATKTNSYRLINGENDGLPSFIADVYAGVLVVKLYSLIWLPYIKWLFPLLLEISQSKTLVLRLSRNVAKEKEHLKGLFDGQVLLGSLPNENIIFKEHGILFSANVIHGHKTGYFLDHRHNRKKVGELSKGKRVLDIFAYAGGFSVHALVGGAKEVISLDISKQALDMAKKNVALNSPKGKHLTMAVDAFKGLQDLIQQGKTFDLVIIDPPSFAKRESERERALHSYAQLAKLGVKLVAKQGILVMASCSSRISTDDFFHVIQSELQKSRLSFTALERTFHDIDHPIGFPEGAYLKCGYWKRD